MHCISRLIYILLFFSCLSSSGQKSLRITSTRLGKPVTRELFIRDELEYKLKGSRHFQKQRIMAFGDSSIVLSNDSIITFDRLKKLRIRKNNYHLKLFQTIFLYGAVGYPLIVTANYFIVPDSQGPALSTAIVSGSFLVGAGIMHELNIRRIRINRHKRLSIVDNSFQDLNGNH